MKAKTIFILAVLAAALLSLASCSTSPMNHKPYVPTGPYHHSIESPYFYWDTTELIMQLNVTADPNAPSSLARRAMAGESDGSASELDDVVIARNADVASNAKTTVRYDYVDDPTLYGWGNNISRIFAEVNSGVSDKPDMYYNFVYDLCCLSLKNSLADLYSEAYGRGMNFLRFEHEYESRGNSYISETLDCYANSFEYMKSLALSDDKLYCYASSYTLDMLRSIFVIPVNIAMVNEIPLADSTGDRGVMDGEYDMYDLYNLVWDGDFTYESIVTLSEAVYSVESDYNVGADLGDVLGFAVSADSDLTAQALIYSSNLGIIDRNIYDDGDYYGYTFYYNENSDKLCTFVDSLRELFSERGVIAVTDEEANAALGSTGRTAIECIRDCFAGNKLLFGGIVQIGELEREEYQQMREGEGLGFVPVPSYCDYDYYNDVGRYYPMNSVISNRARVIGVSRVTDKFEQCTAFLQYQAARSIEIPRIYVDEYLNATLEGESIADNESMFQFITETLADVSKFKHGTFCEDMVEMYLRDRDTLSVYKRLDSLLTDYNYQITSVKGYYDALLSEKIEALEAIKKHWYYHND